MTGTDGRFSQKYREVLSKCSKRSYSILRRNSGGRESSSSGVLGLSLGEGSEVEPTDWLYKGSSSVS